MSSGATATLQEVDGALRAPSGLAQSKNAPGDRVPPRAAAAPRGPVLTASWLAAQGKLPLAFMALGLVWLGLATAMIVAAPETLALSHAAPAVVALAHAWVLGFFVTIAMGAVYQLAPVALSTTLWNERYAWWHFGLQAIAVPGMVFSFARWDMALLGHFGCFFAVGTTLFAVNVWKTVRRSAQRDVVAWSLALAAGWLLLTVLVGLLLSANRFWHFIPLDPLALLRAHAHLGLAGFFLTLLQGVTFRLIPMFTLGEVRDWRPARRGLWLSQLGLLGLAPALAWTHGRVAALCGALVLAGLIASARALAQTLATRKKRVFDPGIRGFLAGGGVLLGAAFTGVLLAWPSTPGGSAPGGFSAMTYAVLVFVGGLLPVFTGMMGKILPFLTWMRAYGPLVGRVPTPAAGALTKPRLESAALVLQALAVLPLLAGVWNSCATSLTVGAWVLAAGIALFLANMIGVLNHLRRPAATPPLAAAKPVHA